MDRMISEYVERNIYIKTIWADAKEEIEICNKSAIKILED